MGNISERYGGCGIYWISGFEDKVLSGLQNLAFILSISFMICDLSLTRDSSFPFLQRSKRTTPISLTSTRASTKDLVVHLMPYFQILHC